VKHLRAEFVALMSSRIGIVAHLIVGRKPEPYLTAVLESIADVCDHAVINDNSGLADGANHDIILRSLLARSGRLTIVHSSFVDFATARNICLDKTPPQFQSAWALFVDADEVHGDELPAMAALLPSLPADICAVDGYSRFFVGSFCWWTELQRSRCFIRLSPRLRWTGKIHERLSPVGRRIALPAQWCQYGHVVTPREEAEKSRLYASLGPGTALTEAQAAAATPAIVWAWLLRKANRFHGQHPRAMEPVIAAMQRERATIFAKVDILAARQTPADRLRNTVRHANALRLIAWRAAEARWRWRWPDNSRHAAFGGARRTDAAAQTGLAIDQPRTNQSARTLG
jgi:hypothetical protein